MVMFETNGKKLYIEKAFKDILDQKIKDVMKNKMDCLIVVQGDEGSAKSFFSRQFCSYIATQTGVPFSVDNIHFNVKDYLEKSEESPKFDIQLFDEGRSDLLSSSSTSKVGKMFSNYLSFCRSMQQFHIILLPRFDDLQKYVILHRASMIITVLRRKNKTTKEYERGFFYVSSTKNKQKLRKLYDIKYSKIPTSMRLIRGTFPNVEAMNEKQYDKKKDDKRKEQFIEQKEENKAVTVPTKLIPILASFKPAIFGKMDSKEWEMGRKWLYSLRKVGKLETGL